MPSVRDKRICAECVGDPYVKGQIEKSKIVNVACDYCDIIRATIDLGELASIVDVAIEAFYEPEYEEGWIENWEFSGEPLIDVLCSLVGLPDGVPEELEQVLHDDWFDLSSHERKYGEDPHFFEVSVKADKLGHAWRQMEDSLRHKARHINPEVAGMLENVFGPVIEDTTYDGQSVIVEIGPGCAIDHLFRARVFQTVEAAENALSHPERHIGPPPPGKGAAGRMNAKGVSVFYGSTTKTIAKSEVRPPVGSFVAVARFRVMRKLRLLDLHALGAVGGGTNGSPLDPETAKRNMRAVFLGDLTKRIVMPVMPELEEQDYLITQAIADFLATHPALNLDGILFSSAQDALTLSNTDDRNVVLFNKASDVARSEERYGSNMKGQLYETDDDETRFEPTMFTEKLPDKTGQGLLTLPPRKEPTLELDRHSIEIFKITKVSYAGMSADVKNIEVQPTSHGRGLLGISPPPHPF